MYEDNCSAIIRQLQHAKRDVNTVVIQVNKDRNNHNSVPMTP